MKIIEPSFEILYPKPLQGEEILKRIETAARTCYKSEDKITSDSAETFVEGLIRREHFAMLEHGGDISVRFISNRGFTHELVRHRLASFAQESTRYCNYSKNEFGNEITVVKPYWYDGTEAGESCKNRWKQAMKLNEDAYFTLLNLNLSAQAARGVLPNDLKTEIVITANIREWRHIMALRTAKAAHPDMRRLMEPLLAVFVDRGLEPVFGSIFENNLREIVNG